MSKPEIFTTAYALDKASWVHLSDDVDFMDYIKNHLGHHIADRIFQECQSGEKIVAVGNTYEKEILELNQVEIREEVRIADLVRCRDCKHYKKMKCLWDEICLRTEMMVGADDYCSYGERRGEE
jgi:hypothetical protein